MIARNESKLKHYQDSLSTKGIECQYFIGDAADFESLKHAFHRIEKELGG